MIIVTNLTSGVLGSGHSSAVTASISAQAGSLVLIAVKNKLDPSGGNTPTVSGGGITWTQVASTSGGKVKMTIFRGVSPTPGALTISFGGQNQDDIHYSVDQFAGAVVTGTTGADGIVQSGVASSVGFVTSLAVSLSSFASPANVAYGALGNDQAQTYTPGSGFTSLFNTTANNSFCSEYAYNAPSVGWSFASSSLLAAVAVEVKAQTPGAAVLGAFL